MLLWDAHGCLPKPGCTSPFIIFTENQAARPSADSTRPLAAVAQRVSSAATLINKHSHRQVMARAMLAVTAATKTRTGGQGARFHTDRYVSEARRANIKKRENPLHGAHCSPHLLNTGDALKYREAVSNGHRQRTSRRRRKERRKREKANGDDESFFALAALGRRCTPPQRE